MNSTISQKTGTGSSIRQLQMREILDWADTLEIPKSEPVFITGDFNVEYDTPEFKAFLAEFPLAIDYHKDEAVGGSFSAKVSRICALFMLVGPFCMMIEYNEYIQ